MAFRECSYWHAVKPDLFAEDFKFIRYLGEATDVREAKANAADFQDSYELLSEARERRYKAS